jgi:signal transduction histidine kinase
MKKDSNHLARRYGVALQKHLKAGSPPGAAAANLGRQAVANGLETLDLVRIHERTLAQLVAARGSGALGKLTINRATAFFTEVLAPIEQTHRAATRGNAQMKRLANTLGRNAVDLATSHRELQQDICRRKTAEQALQKSGRDTGTLLAESRRLQQHLRLLTRQILATQEDKRRLASSQLHDEIAQTLLGINVWLLALKATTTANTQSLQKEIASMERLVKKSTRTMRRFAHEFGSHHEA